MKLQIFQKLPSLNYLDHAEIPDLDDPVVAAGCHKALVNFVPADDIHVAVVRLTDRDLACLASRRPHVPKPYRPIDGT